MSSGCTLPGDSAGDAFFTPTSPHQLRGGTAKDERFEKPAHNARRPTLRSAGFTSALCGSCEPSTKCRSRALSDMGVSVRDQFVVGPSRTSVVYRGSVQSVEDWSIARYTRQEPPDLTDLLGPSLDEQHGLVRRTVDDWADGSNRFSKPGEAFYVASVGDAIVGMCGLNIDPFIDDQRVGRIRHLYVHPGYRRRQIGRSLLDACLLDAAESFTRVRLRTFQPVAVSFYESIGFVQTDEPAATHSLSL